MIQSTNRVRFASTYDCKEAQHVIVYRATTKKQDKVRARRQQRRMLKNDDLDNKYPRTGHDVS